MPSTTEPFDPENGAAFERIDWDEVGGPRRRLTAERLTLVAGLLVVAAVYVYFRTQRRTILAWGWNIGNEDWLLLVSAALIVAYGVVPLLKAARRHGRLLEGLGRNPLTVICMAFLSGLLAVSLWANMSGFQPSLWSPETGMVDGFQRPALAGGTWDHPLGTDRWGYDMVDLLLVGTRPLAYLSVVTLGLIAPLATVVGMASGYYGGRVDDVLSTYVDAQISVPAILVYMVAYMFFFNSMAMLLVAFGLLSWGSIEIGRAHV